MAGFEKSIRRFLSPNLHGLTIDGLFIFLNLLIFPFVAIGIENIFGDSFEDEADNSAMAKISVVVFIALSGRLLGLYLKRFSLQARKNTPKNYTLINSLWFISMVTTLLSTVIILLAIIHIVKVAGIANLNDSYYVTDVGIPIIVIFTTLFEVCLLYFWIQSPLTDGLEEKRKRGNWRFSRVTEVIADIGLFINMFVWQGFFALFVSTVVRKTIFASFFGFVFAIIMSALVFILFYLAPRTVFFIEDAYYKSTWFGVFLVFITAIFSNLAWNFVLGY